MSGYAGIRYQGPGVHGEQETVEGAIGWGEPFLVNASTMRVLMAGTSRDLGHTSNTTILRPGLAVGYHKANKKWVPFVSTATADQGDVCLGFVAEPMDMQRDGTDTDRFVKIIYKGNVKADSILLNEGTPGTMVGHATEAAFRAALSSRFILDDFFEEY